MTEAAKSDHLQKPPVATRRPHSITAHGDERIDDLYWLRDRDDPAVIGLLEAENAFTDATLASTQELQDDLYAEIRSHIQETDLSVPVRQGAFWYFSRTVEGKPYSVNCRRPAENNDRTPPDPEGDSPDEQVLLDVNYEAEGTDYFRVGMFDVSPDSTLLAWSKDTSGGEVYAIRFRDLSTGKDLADSIERASYSSAWSADSSYFFYTKPDDAMRPFQLWRHRIGSDAGDDTLILQEDDERFFLRVGASKDQQVLVMTLNSAITSEAHWLAADDPEGDWQIVTPRRQGIEYDVDHRNGQFLIVTNDEAINFRLVAAPVASPGAVAWTNVIPVEPDVRLLSIEVFKDFLLLHERAEGLTRIRIVGDDPAASHIVEVPESPGTITPIDTPDYDSPLLRFSFSSMVTPATVVDYDVVTRQSLVRKQQPVPAYDRDLYVTSRTWATASDGKRVPISIAHRRDVTTPAACLLYGYGSYELPVDPTFSALRLPLLDRGWVYAVAHVRGGGEMGRPWYEDGKFLNKINTFTDFTASADHLIEQGVTEPQRIVARGASAGGLLMGAVTNLRPELFAGVLAGVPFVDCLTTILDPSLPLTVIEWEEWGNPVEDEATYHYMKSYSPYDNVRPQDYPAILAVGGLNDPRVSFWEPLKWVQRLRDNTTSHRPILLRTEMGAGHGGPSDRYESWRRESMMLAWALSLPGV